MSNKLTPLQQKIFSLLDAKPNTDVMISTLYHEAFGDTDMVHPDGSYSSVVLDTRDMQQRLGPLLARINLKLKRGRIVPGALKRTYRLDTKNYKG